MFAVSISVCPWLLPHRANKNAIRGRRVQPLRGESANGLQSIVHPHSSVNTSQDSDCASAPGSYVETVQGAVERTVLYFNVAWGVAVH
jgi:hypothetical protein